MKLQVKERESQIKKEAKRVRREGEIPAVLYSKGQANRQLTVQADEFHTHLRHTPKGHLSSKKFTLKDQPVNINIPLNLTGAADCVGVKLGGVIRPVLRYLKVRCLPKHIPDTFDINVADLKMGQSKRLSSIHLQDHIRPLMNLNDVAVIIAKR